MREVLRVTKPGGTVVIINHFRSRNRLLAALDTLIEPISRRLGWQTLGIDEVVGGVPLRSSAPTRCAAAPCSPSSSAGMEVSRNAPPTGSAPFDSRGSRDL